MEEAKTIAAEPRVRPMIPAHAFVFAASFCLMVIEIVAGRIMAPYLGSSIYTWTSVIGVVLTGITVGNYMGGVLAEKGATRKTLGGIFFFSAFSALFSFYMYEPTHVFLNAFDLPVPLAAFVFAIVGFFPVSFFLSLVTPIVITLSLDSLKKTGTTVGSVYAVSAFASILGTFLTGYVFVSFFGVKLIVLVVAAVLMLVGFTALADKQLRSGAPMIMFLALLWMGMLMRGFCTMETAYYCIRIQDLGGGQKAILLDHLLHSIVTPDPKVLMYDYENVYAVAAEHVWQRKGAKGALSALYIGGGGYVMPRYIEATYPGSEQMVVEIDPGVTEAAVRYLGFDPNGPIGSVNMDGRLYLSKLEEGKKYDLVYGDAFNDYSVPSHLTTKEFVTLVRDHLEPHGMYALNVIDDYRFGNVLASFAQTIGEVFPYVEIAPLQVDWERPVRNTFIILASNEPIDRERWASDAMATYADKMSPPFAIPLVGAQFLVPEDKKREYLSTRERRLTLTDDFVPVDNMLAPIFAAAGRY